MAADRTIAYVSSTAGREVITLAFNADARTFDIVARTLIPLEGESIPGNLPMVFSARHKVLHVALPQLPHRVSSFAIADNGALNFLGSAELPHRPSQLLLDRAATMLFTVSFLGGSVSVSPLTATGAVDPVTHHLDGLPEAHGVAIAPDSSVLYVASMATDTISGYRIDHASRRLAPEPFDTVRSAPGAGPRFLAMNSKGDQLYAITEHHGSILVLDRDLATGALQAVQTVSMLPDSIHDPKFVALARRPPGAADIRLSADEKLLFASDRITNSVAVFAVDSDTGRLRPLANSRVVDAPRSVAPFQNGRLMLAAGTSSGTIVLYAVDPDSGALQQAWTSKLADTIDWVEVIEPGVPASSSGAER